MNSLKNVRSFRYRPTRIQAGFKVKFITDSGLVEGICRNISGEGMRAELLDSLDVGTCGQVILYHPSRTIELEARIAYQDGGESAFVFQFRSAWEREQVSALMTANDQTKFVLNAKRLL